MIYITQYLNHLQKTIKANNSNHKPDEGNKIHRYTATKF